MDHPFVGTISSALIFQKGVTELSLLGSDSRTIEGVYCEDTDICMQHKDNSKSSTMVLELISTTKPLTND